ncbi:helix-turn-helix domain-containing protein [Nocardioides sp. T5]|uniref:helix-turn-helix domain-containing protein n=1 Tax=Nocardioides sp. T5 TaxID=3400182 RepID=UPI003A88DBE2
MTAANVPLEAGARLLGEDGYLLVAEIGRHSVTVESSTGDRRDVPYGEINGVRITNGQAPATTTALEPWWSGLSEQIRRDALDKLEVVHEVLTGYRWGHPRLAQPGEPFLPVSDPGLSETQRCRAMARQLSYEQRADRQILRRIQDGELRSATVSENTVQKWIRDWRDDGLRGLVDKRSTKGRQGFEALDERLRRIADDVFARFNGDDSKVNIKTVEAEIRLQMKSEGLKDVRLPQRLFQEYLSARHQALGRTTRAHRSRYLRHAASSHTSFPAMHPAHLALDATRADVLVWDEVHECPRSVEVLTVISVATRVVVALRVTPRSGNAVEAGLVLYDAMRPMSMLVDGTKVDDWRWCPVRQAGFADTEVGSDLLEVDARLTISGNPNDVLAELLGIRLRHGAHPSSGTSRHHRSDVTYSCSSPWFAGQQSRISHNHLTLRTTPGGARNEGLLPVFEPAR